MLRGLTVRVHDLGRRARILRLRARIRYIAARNGAQVKVSIDRSVEFEGIPEIYLAAGTRNRLEIGPDAVIGSLVRFDLRAGDLLIGPGTDVRRLCRLNVKGRCVVGSEVVLSTGVHVHCAEHVSIDQWTIVGEYTTIADSNHLRTDEDHAIHHSSENAPVQIGRNVWVGAKVTIAKGVTVGDQAFVAANSVVTRDVEPWWLVAGSPAAPVKRLEQHEG